MCMPQTRKILRMLGWVIAGLCVTVLILAAAIRVDQYLLRRKAERLLADLKSLEMRKSTYQDARQVMDRWEEEMHQEGPCRPYWCDVWITLGDFIARHQVFFANHQKFTYWFRSIYRFLGARPEMITGSIRVRRNFVWGKGIGALIENYTVHTLVGAAHSGFHSNVISSLHPEYAIEDKSGRWIYAEVVFTPYADPKDVRRLMDINFSCLTSRHPCKTVADILPTAWNEYTAEEQLANDSVLQQKCSPDVIRVLSRESERVVIGEVINLVSGVSNWACDSSQRCTLVPTPRVILQSDLKPRNPLFPSDPEFLLFSHLLPMKAKLGDKYIFFFAYPIVEYSVDRDSACSPLPATNENLEAVRRGIAEDWADHNREFLSPSPGLGDLKPPEIQVR